MKIYISDRSTLAELRRTRVCLSDFKILETIGRGHFAEVQVSHIFSSDKYKTYFI